MIQREDEYEFVRENLRNINLVVVLILETKHEQEDCPTLK